MHLAPGTYRRPLSFSLRPSKVAAIAPLPSPLRRAKDPKAQTGQTAKNPGTEARTTKTLSLYSSLKRETREPFTGSPEAQGGLHSPPPPTGHTETTTVLGGSAKPGLAQRQSPPSRHPSWQGAQGRTHRTRKLGGLRDHRSTTDL